MLSKTAFVAACLFGVSAANAGAEQSVWDGVYSAAQAERGQALYTKECASCHHDNLKGHGPTPSLSGQAFLDKWDGQTLGDIFEKIQSSMPADHPGTLSRETNAAILAFILRFNQFPAGPTDLKSEAEWLASIRFKSVKGK